MEIMCTELLFVVFTQKKNRDFPITVAIDVYSHHDHFMYNMCTNCVSYYLNNNA